MKRDRILHLFNTAGVSGALVKLLRTDKDLNLRYKAKFISRKNSSAYDLDKYYEKYGTYIGGDRALYFYIYVLFNIFFTRPRFIHIHAWINGIKFISRLKKLLFYKPIIIYHAHGTEVRDKTLPPFFYSKVDYYIVSTEDLFDSIPKARFMSVPIDTDLFFKNNDSRDFKSALFFLNNLPLVNHNFLSQAIHFCNKNNLKLNIVKNREGKHIPFSEMGNEYRKHKFFLDFKGIANRRGDYPILSKAALEASSCGCVVVQESYDQFTHEDLAQTPLLQGNFFFKNFYIDIHDKVYEESSF